MPWSKEPIDSANGSAVHLYERRANVDDTAVADRMHESGTSFEYERSARTATNGDAPTVPGNAYACASHSERCVLSFSAESPSLIERRELAFAAFVPRSLCMLRPYERARQ